MAGLGTGTVASRSVLPNRAGKQAGSGWVFRQGRGLTRTRGGGTGNMRKFGIAILIALPLAAQQARQFKPGFNLFSPQQDVQMGQEAAAEVEKTMPVVRDPVMTDYITRI